MSTGDAAQAQQQDFISNLATVLDKVTGKVYTEASLEYIVLTWCWGPLSF